MDVREVDVIMHALYKLVTIINKDIMRASTCLS
jgi:hypothetical protein